MLHDNKIMLFFADGNLFAHGLRVEKNININSLKTIAYRNTLTLNKQIVRSNETVACRHRRYVGGSLFGR